MLAELGTPCCKDLAKLKKTREVQADHSSRLCEVQWDDDNFVNSVFCQKIAC